MIAMIARLVDNSTYGVFPSWAIAVAAVWAVVVIASGFFVFRTQAKAK